MEEWKIEIVTLEDGTSEMNGIADNKNVKMEPVEENQDYFYSDNYQNIKFENGILNYDIKVEDWKFKQEIQEDGSSNEIKGIPNNDNVKIELIHENDKHVYTDNYENIKIEKKLNTELIIKDEIIDGTVLESKQIRTGEKPFVCDICNKTNSTRGCDDEATTRTSNGSRGPRGKNAQYYRDYRARKRAEQEKRSLNRTSDASTTADSSTINVEGSVTSKQRKSAAEYQREYRARKKAKRENILNDSLAIIPSILTGGFTTTHQSTIVDQLTTAGFSINLQSTAELSINRPTTAGPLTSSDIGFAKPTRRKTPAEYQREYRARKKAQRESTRPAKTNDGSMEIADKNTSNIGDENARIKPQVPYTQFHQHKKAYNYIRTKFTENNFGFAYSI